MPRRACTTADRIKVTFYDPKRGASISVTVYGGRLEAVAEKAVEAVRRRWRVTSLSDRRHKRRL